MTEIATAPRRVYYRVAFWLMLLLALTVGASYLQLGSMSAPVAMSIALVKAAIIALYFMHVRYGSPLVKLFAAAGLFWVLIMFLLAFSDYATRS